MKLPARATICEVGTRDGFQIEPDFIPTELKVEVVDLLSDAGVPRIEVTSFVHPKVVPQLRDAEAVMAKIRRRPGVRYAALVPNDKGAVRAVDAGVNAIHTVVSASESHNLANVNMTIAESMEKLRAVMQVAARAKVAVSCGISTSFGCPFEGDVPLDQLESVVGRLVDMGAEGSHGMQHGDRVVGDEGARDRARPLPEGGGEQSAVGDALGPREIDRGVGPPGERFHDHASGWAEGL